MLFFLSAENLHGTRQQRRAHRCGPRGDHPILQERPTVLCSTEDIARFFHCYVLLKSRVPETFELTVGVDLQTGSRMSAVAANEFVRILLQRREPGTSNAAVPVTETELPGGLFRLQRKTQKIRLRLDAAESVMRAKSFRCLLRGSPRDALLSN